MYKYFTSVALCFFICFSLHSQTTVNYKIENNMLILPDNLKIVFETGSDKLLPESDEAIAYVISFLKAKTYVSTLRIEGHIIRNGEESKMQKQSEKRALAIARKIAKQIDCKRLIAVGFGSTKPVADNNDIEVKWKNTRIEFCIAAMRERPIGGMPVDGGGMVAGEVCE